MSDPEIYRPLLPGGIRLLRLLPSRDGLIEGELLPYSLLESDNGSHLYEALSYVWGSWADSQSMSLSGRKMTITSNLHKALSSLRDPALERIIWIDALCIDQNEISERNQQIRLMAEIYSKASRVIVWLGPESPGSNQVFKEIRLAADKDPAAPGVDEQTRAGILELLQRKWFTRVWVLQEAAAARHIVIRCGSAEIDGYVFCSGLDSSNVSYDSLPNLQSVIRSVTYLIREAIFRPKAVTRSSGQVSLDIRPLGELIDMYHTRDATDSRDKIYALLGMSSDSPRLSPEYGIPFKQALENLVMYLFPEQILVEAVQDKMIAVIKSSGCVLGVVSSVKREATRDDRQIVEVTSKNEPENGGQKTEWTSSWLLQTFAQAIQEGDVVCLLEGASTPSIVRIHEDYCSVIAISVTPPESFQVKGGPSLMWSELVQSATFQHYFLLVWNWEGSHEDVQEEGNYEALMITQMPEQFKVKLEDPLDSPARLRHIGLISADSEKYELADRSLRSAITAHGRISDRDLPLTLLAMDVLASLHERQGSPDKERAMKMMTDMVRRTGEFATITEMTVASVIKFSDMDVIRVLLDRRGSDLQITKLVVEEVGRNQAQNDIMRLLLDRKGEKIDITEEATVKILSRFDEEIIRLFLDRRGDEVWITGQVAIAAHSNAKINGKEVMQFLLGRTEDKVRVREWDITQIAAYFDDEVMGLLLDRKGSEVQISEPVVRAAAGNIHYAIEVLGLLLNRRGSEIQITESVVNEAVTNTGGNADGLMKLLLDRRGIEIRITKDVVNAIIASSGESTVALMKLLLDRRDSEIQITEEMVETLADRFPDTKGLMELLIMRRQDEFVISRRLIVRTIERYYNRLFDLLYFMLEKNAKITSEAMMEIAEKHPENVLRLLLDQERDDLPVTQEFLEQVVGNYSVGNDLLGEFLDGAGSKLEITVDVLLATAKYPFRDKDERMRLLRDRARNAALK